MSRFEDLPYRPCVGTTVINRDGRVFIGRRIDGPEHVDWTHVWQMPQGGLDDGEDTYTCALRELYEETNIKSVEHLGTIDDWLIYDIPREIVGQAWKGKCRSDAKVVRAALHR
jgi:putative (di)nucleoside polyphosphate hydrolase